MRRWAQRGTQYLHEEDGATMVEYAMVLGLVCGVCIGLVTVLGQYTLQLFNKDGSAMAKALSSP